MTGQQQRQHATNLINDAVFFLLMERPSDATRALRQAALALQETSGTSSNNNNSLLGSDSTTQQGRSPFILPVKIRRKQRDETLRECIYDRALNVSNSNQNDEVISATILYNMGLLHHLKGLDQGKCEYVNKALRLYQTALIILARCDNFLSASICQSINLLRLALLNNSAQIHLHLFQREGLDESLYYIRFILDNASITVLSSRDENQEDEYNCYSFFLINAMICSGDLLNIAPAA
jgi:hypothetical protein